MVSIACLVPLACDRDDPQPASLTAFDQKRFEEGLVGIETWLGKGKPDAAEVIARRLVELDPDSVEALEAHGRCLIVLAALRDHEGATNDATDLRLQAHDRYQAAVQIAGETPRISLLHEAGIAAAAAGQPEQALALHVRAAQLDPNDAKHAIFTGNMLARLERPEQAREWFTRATELDPSEPWGWAGLAETHRQDGNHDTALTAIRTARAAAPSSSGFRVAEARILRESGRGREAAMLLFAVQPDERATRTITEELAAACTQIGDHRRAAIAWEALHARNPDDLGAMTEAAMAWIRAEDDLRAASWLEAAENAGASPSEIERVRARLSP
jgi:tetratricopeptide (TPR) repeat protein